MTGTRLIVLEKRISDLIKIIESLKSVINDINDRVKTLEEIEEMNREPESHSEKQLGEMMKRRFPQLKEEKGCGKVVNPKYWGITCGDINPFDDKIFLCDNCEKRGEQNE
jgi:hypothetical protein